MALLMAEFPLTAGRGLRQRLRMVLRVDAAALVIVVRGVRANKAYH